MSDNLAEKVFYQVYNLAWGAAIPAFRLSHRLANGFEQRTLQQRIPPADLWIQAASAGESYLASALVRKLNPEYPIRVLLTSNTDQGITILKRTIEDTDLRDRLAATCVTYFPFDKPSIMEKAVQDVCPKIMVLLESEMWPALLGALKRHGCQTLIINGRISDKSLNRYLLWPSLWRTLMPDKILAVSQDDAKRFARLFDKERVDIMPNMKFDRFAITDPVPLTKSPVENVLQPGMPLLVMGSVRREEEPFVEKIIGSIRHRLPETIIGLFPRHMHRLNHWKNALNRLALPWVLRSKTQEQAPYGTVILWDTFGELTLAYKLSRAAFVGGSLAPLGGQNFLEALACGVIPVIGPSWENFAWVGHEIVQQKLVRIGANWKEVADILVDEMQKSPSHLKVRKMALRYMNGRRGGTAHACRVIVELLNQAQRSQGTDLE